MILGKLIKPCKICIYEQDETEGEIESFTLLKLSLQEVMGLVQKAADASRIELPLDGSIVILYSGDDTVHKEWKRLAVEHSKDRPHTFVDASRKYESKTPGKSCLVRDPVKHIIRIAWRRGNDTCTINRICIGADATQRFFTDAKLGAFYRVNGRYGIDTRDLDTYTYWSRYMNSKYLDETGQSREENPAEKPSD